MCTPLSIGLKTSRFFVCKFVNLQTKCGAPPAAGKPSAGADALRKGRALMSPVVSEDALKPLKCLFL